MMNLTGKKKLILMEYFTNVSHQKILSKEQGVLEVEHVFSVVNKNWIKIMNKIVEDINYDNFKNSISPEQSERHNSYLNVWTELRKLKKWKNYY